MSSRLLKRMPSLIMSLARPISSDWQSHPPYVSSAKDFIARYKASCFCGSVTFEVCDEPVDAKYCHCNGCQKLHGAPFQWAVILNKNHVYFTRGLECLQFYNSEESIKGHVLPCKLSCTNCNSIIADEGRRTFLAMGSLFDFGHPPKIPKSFQPSCHIFYSNHMVEMNDNLPKYIGHKNQSQMISPSENSDWF